MQASRAPMMAAGSLRDGSESVHEAKDVRRHHLLRRLADRAEETLQRACTTRRRWVRRRRAKDNWNR